MCVNRRAISGDRYVIKREAEKFLNYKDLINTEHVECESKSHTVIIGATGTISKSFRQYLNNTPGHTKSRNLKKKKPSNIGHCTQSLASTNAKVQNISCVK